MRLRFTKMQGAGNDFVMLDATKGPIELSAEQLRRLGDRRFGVGADQILLVEPARRGGVDFSYRIFNNTGDEVEHCGNGARCFVRFVRDKGLTARDTIRVETMNRVLDLNLQSDGRVAVDMQAPVFEHAALPFDASGLVPRQVGQFELWPLPLDGGRAVEVAVLSMGNPHAVQRVDDVAAAPVVELGALIESHPRFARKVNAGFMQVLSRSEIALRVYERHAGETLSCGTGACAAVVAGVRLGWLDARVDVHTRGGVLSVEWPGGDAAVIMTGPAHTVFEGEIEL
ncbi:MAG: diaminopimelate epimerase [Burkholderiaceae bacterium]|nr:MAG: diaminopimelate epimerase [Burkholderiaceae bacterium]MBE7424619.1 diaminopimelate epimerase [Ideonella sp.]MCC7287685.1 diaminopimelate epimerase [Burkholderiaceae bacterium]